MRIFILLGLTFLSNAYINAQCTLACYTDFYLTLDAGGHATISAEDVLASYGPTCGTLIVEPSIFECSDIGTPIAYTVTDPESGNSCGGNIHVLYEVGAMSCYADVNVELDPSGTKTLTPDMLLYDPPGACIPGAIISPATVSCADIGSPVLVTITDPVSGNSCGGNIHVIYEVGAMSCYADVNVELDPSGTKTLTPDMLLYDPPGACIPGAINSPATVSCADIEAPVLVTITDPVTGNSCSSTIVVVDPRPASCEIIAPGTIMCGDTGVPFSVSTTGGYGPFEYTWEIKGNPHGWFILTGQGTDNITMAVGDGKIKLEVTITDLCGKKRKCSIKPECEGSPGFGESEPKGFSIVSQETPVRDLEVFPNPASQNLWVQYPDWTSTETSRIYIVDQLGRLQVKVRYDALHSARAGIDIQDMRPGVYWLILEDVAHKTMIRKFVKL